MEDHCVREAMQIGNHGEVVGSEDRDALVGGMQNQTIRGGARGDTLIGDVFLGDNLLVNGSFEDHGSLSNGSWGLFKSIDGWKKWGKEKFEIQHNSEATEGRAIVELDGDDNAGMFQRISGLDASAQYQISVDYSARSGVSASSNTIEVWWAGEMIDEITLDGTDQTSLDFHTYSYTVTAPANGKAWLGFRGAGESDSLGGLIDNAQLQEVREATDPDVGGHDYLDGGDGSDVLMGKGGIDYLEGGTQADRLDGGSGSDTTVYINAESAVTVDLSTGRGYEGEAQGDQYVSIENVLGSLHDDRVRGDDGSNRLNGVHGRDRIEGGAGNDTIVGGGGADDLDGGEGNLDVADYGSSFDGVNVNLTEGTGQGGHAEGDVLRNLESVNGSYHNDQIIGDENVNRLYGNHGQDQIFGMGGNDILRGGHDGDHLDGGEGDQDVADYLESAVGVHVDLAAGQGYTGHAEGDTLVGIENVYGSNANDIIVGDDGNNRLSGFDGDDAISGGDGRDFLDGGLGADALDGGAGNADVASYQNAESGVSLRLNVGGVSGEAAGDTFANIEWVYGSDFGDKIEGDNGANRLVGFSGDDALMGAGGRDTLIGGEGNDVMTGGTGFDIFLMSAAFGDDRITDFEAGEGLGDRIWLRGMGLDENDLSIADTTAGAVVTAGGFGTILLENVSANQLAEDDFLF